MGIRHCRALQLAASTVLLLAGLLLNANTAAAQANLSLTGDTLICAGDSAQLNLDIDDSGFQCSYAIIMLDPFGQGWGNAQVEVFVNGSFSSTHTLVAGILSIDSVSFFPGDTVEFYYVSGITPGFNFTWDVFAADGTPIYSGTGGIDGLQHTMVVDCGLSLPTYDVLWSPTTGLSDSTSLTPTASPATTTTYTAFLLDSVGMPTDSTSITVSVVPNFTLNAAASPEVLCLSGSTALSATVGGSGNFTYAWTPANLLDSASNANPTATFTQAGNFTFEVEVASDSGCVKTEEVTVVVSGSVPSTVSVLGDTVFCEGESTDLLAEINPVGTTGCQYVLVMNDAAGDGWQGAQVEISINGVISTHTIAFGIQAFDTINVNQDDVLEVSYFPAIFALDDNWYSLEATDGTVIWQDGPFPTQGLAFSTVVDCGITSNGWTYEWMPGTGLSDSTSAAVTASISGTQTYTVIASDTSCGFADTTTITLTSAPTFGVQLLPGDTNLCLGQDLAVSAMADTTGSLSYQWSGSGINYDTPTAASATATFTDPGNNAVVVDVSAPWGCTVTDSFMVAVSTSPVPAVTIEGNQNICDGDTVQLTANTGPGPGSLCDYVLELEVVFGFGWNGAEVIITLDGVSTSYEITNGGFFQAFNVPVIQGQSLVVQYVGPGPGGPPGQVYTLYDFEGNVVVTDGPGAPDGISFTGTATCGGNEDAVYLYEWAPTNLMDDASAQSPMIWPANDTTFVVVVTDSVGGCTATDTFDVAVNEFIPVTVTQVTDSFCSNATNTLTLVASEPGGMWSGSGIADASAGTWLPSQAAVGTNQIIYTLNDFGDCASRDTLTITVLQTPDGPTVEAQSGCANEDLVLNVTSNGGTIEWYEDFNQTTLLTTGDTYNAGLLTGSGVYWIIATNGQCVSGASALAWEAIPAPSSSPILGPNTVVAQNAANYSMVNNADNDYNWMVTGGTVTTGQGTNATEIVWGAEGMGQIAVVETNPEGCDGDTVFLMVDIGPNGVNELSVERLEVYPNPTSDLLYMQLPASVTGGTVLVRDMAGRVVATQRFNTSRLNPLHLDQLKAGIYMVEVTGASVVLRERVVLR